MDELTDTGRSHDTHRADGDQTAHPRPGILRRFIEIFALSGLAFTQPLFDAYQRSPLEFIGRGVLGSDLVLFAALLLLVPPLTLLIVESLIGIASGSAMQRLHRIFVGGLLGLFLLQLFPAGPVIGLVALTVAVASSALLVYMYLRLTLVRDWLALLAIAPVLFSYLFLSNPTVRPLVSGGTTLPGSLPHDRHLPPIVLVVLDELPTLSLLSGDGRLDGVSFPAFARLARDGRFFVNNATIASWTSISVPAIVSGRYPEIPSNLAHWSQHPQTFFSWLGGAYEMFVVEASTGLCPPPLCPEPDSRLGDLLASVPSTWARIVSPLSEPEIRFEAPAGSGRRNRPQELVGEALARLGESDGPTFTYLHLQLPHHPWERTPRGLHYDGPVPARGLERYAWADEFSAQAARQRHLLQVSYADHVLETLLDGLADLGLYDEAIIVVTADHGVSFVPGESFRAITPENALYISRTPLIVKGPGLSPDPLDTTPTQVVDILPTVAEMAGLPLPWAVDGVSLLDPARDRDRRYYPADNDEIPSGPQHYFLLDSTDTATALADADTRRGNARLYTIGSIDELASDVDLLGIKVNDLPVGSAGPRITVSDAYESPPDSPYFEIRLPADATGNLAIAVDGTIAIVTSTTSNGQDKQAWGVLPDELLTSYRSDISFYLIERSSHGAVLVPLQP